MKKSELLRELGWNDELIKNYILDDDGFDYEEEPNISGDIFETNSMIITYNSDTSASNLIIDA